MYGYIQAFIHSNVLYRQGHATCIHHSLSPTYFYTRIFPWQHSQIFQEKNPSWYSSTKKCNFFSIKQIKVHTDGTNGMHSNLFYLFLSLLLCFIYLFVWSTFFFFFFWLRLFSSLVSMFPFYFLSVYFFFKGENVLAFALKMIGCRVGCHT